MAVSGRKLSDFQGSISLGSAEDFEKHVIASKDSEEYTEKCSVHKNEIVKFFCPTHKALGCNDCIILDHRECKIDYISDTCADIGDSEEYMDIMEKLNEKMKDVEDIMKKAEVRDKEIDKCHADIIKEILNFRKEINERLDQLQQEIQKDADKKKSKDENIIQMVRDECANISSDIKKLQSKLEANKTSKQNEQLYINIKRAESKLKSDEVKKADKNLAKTYMQYSFERNTDIENVLSRDNIFGKLNLNFCLVTPTEKKIFKTLTYKEDIDVRTKADTGWFYSYITGCAILSTNKLVLADKKEYKLKVLDRQSTTVIEEKRLDSSPTGIAVMPKDQIAVTVPGNKEILIMETAGKLTTVRKIPVQCDFRGITYHQDYLYLLCKNPKSVLVLDTQGTLQYTISLNNDIFKHPKHLVVSEDSRHIYINDYVSDCLVSITLQGDVSAVYKHNALSGQRGMVMLDDGSLLVCCYNSNTIHHISGDLKQGQTMIDYLQRPHSICYSHYHDEVYIGCWGNQLKVFSMK
ncbi:uncharacterized protein LOC123537572 [Mercenaria mercenaria]|uniref:uncharacterized protein LOC123537572 n=1 Tax=Mercenaria mercenaria TaxID=6596 RepID=UPI00234F95B0|nr:uncharacterized protein LOC123537572 [Mercenaria mercenaria]